MTSEAQKSELSEIDLASALIQNQVEENLFVRHYEETRFKITQMTITLSGLLIGALRFGNSQQHTGRLVGAFIVILGFLGVLISAKYTERADRHAALSRSYRRAASGLLSKLGNGDCDIEKLHETAALKHRKTKSITGLLHNVRARSFWMGIHVLMIILGLVIAIS
jgi:hypothetical protein